MDHGASVESKTNKRNGEVGDTWQITNNQNKPKATPTSVVVCRRAVVGK